MTSCPTAVSIPAMSSTKNVGLDGYRAMADREAIKVMVTP
jgi:hypothetical protein